MDEEFEHKALNDDLGLINYIMLGRIYDLLMIIADAQGKGEEALKLMELHRQGNLMAPFPSLDTRALNESDQKDS